MLLEKGNNMDIEIMQKKFENYMNEFKKQTTTDKQKEIIKSYKELIAVLDVICAVNGIKLEYLKSREINDLDSGLVSEDDFLEGSIVYIENIKNIVSQFMIVKGDVD